MTEKISVIYPLYETGQNVQKALASMDKQTHTDWELLLFDARWESEDYGKQLPDSIENHEKVKKIVCAHRNAAALLNDGIETSSGKYVILLPPDIYYKPELLEKYLACFRQNQNTAMVYSDFETLKKDGSLQQEGLFPYKGQVDEGFSLGYVKMYKKEAVQEKGLFNEDLNYAEEYDMLLKLGDDYLVDFVASAEYIADSTREGGSDDDAEFTRLFSPGSSGKGAFSYLMYTREQEREYEFSFKEMLKRRGAFLTKRNEVVPYHSKTYETMVSIVIPILNRKRFIKNTIQSILNGTYPNFEVLVVDNGSTDGTQQEVLSIDDERVRLIQHDGSCIAEALNVGIRQARGKYIAQCDSDDEYTPNTLYYMVSHMESHPRCGLAISYYNLIDEESNVLDELPIVKHLEFDRNNILRVGGGGALRFFHKGVLEEFGLYDEENYGNFAEDYDMVTKVSEKYDVDRVHRVLYRYRRHEDNTDVTRDPVMKIENKNNIRLNAIKRRQELVKKGIR